MFSLTFVYINDIYKTDVECTAYRKFSKKNKSGKAKVLLCLVEMARTHIGTYYSLFN